MRARTVLGSTAPAWATPSPPLQRDTSKAAVHASGCVRRRGWPATARQGYSSPLVGEDAEECAVLVGSARRHRLVPPLRAGTNVGEKGVSDETSMLQHDPRFARASGAGAQSSSSAHGSGENGTSVDAGGGEAQGDTRELTPTELQQQAMISKLKMLEARRDWSGVLTEMVRVNFHTLHAAVAGTLHAAVASRVYIGVMMS